VAHEEKISVRPILLDELVGCSTRALHHLGAKFWEARHVGVVAKHRCVRRVDGRKLLGQLGDGRPARSMGVPVCVIARTPR
jgi:hypothetical protein